MVSDFYNTCLNSLNISSFFSSGIIISSTFLEFSLITGFCFKIFSSFNLATACTILFPINSLVSSAALWTTFLGAFFKASSPVSSNQFLYFLDKFPANYKNPYPLTYFLVFGSIDNVPFLFIN